MLYIILLEYRYIYKSYESAKYRKGHFCHDILSLIPKAFTIFLKIISYQNVFNSIHRLTKAFLCWLFLLWTLMTLYCGVLIPVDGAVFTGSQSHSWESIWWRPWSCPWPRQYLLAAPKEGSSGPIHHPRLYCTPRPFCLLPIHHPLPTRP